MISHRLINLLGMCIGIAVALLGAAAPAAAATSGSVDVVLDASAHAEIRILDHSITLAPSSADVAAGYVSAEGADGIAIQVRSNSSTGAALEVGCADAAPQIVLGDLLVRTATPAGGGGVSASRYTAVQAADQIIWSSDSALPLWTTVRTDVRIQGLRRYVETARAGDHPLTNTLVFTVVVQ